MNHPQAFPKFLASAYVRKGGLGIVHQFLVPSTVKTMINGRVVTIACRTKYPFGQVLSYSVESATPFDFYIRVPEWAGSGSTITTTDSDTPLLLEPNTEGLYKVAVRPGSSEFSVNFNAEVRVVPRPNNTVAIYRGSLLYALEFDYSITETPALNWTDRTPLPQDQITSNVHDHEILPVSVDSWSVAIDPSQIVVHDDSALDGSLQNPIYTNGGPPVYLSVAASQINWPENDGTAGLPPSTPQLLGSPFIAKLVPYGSVKVHMAELPSVSLTKLVQ